MSSQGAISGKKANNNPGLCPVKGQKFGLCSQTGAPKSVFEPDYFPNKTAPHYQMLVIHPAFYLCFMFCIETPKDGTGPTNFWIELYLASLLAISFTCTPACPGTQYSPTMCRVKISFNSLWHCCTNGDAVLAAWRAFRATCKIRELVQNTRAHYCHCSIQMGVMLHTSTHYNTLMFVREATFTAEHVNIVICILSYVKQLSLQAMEVRVANNHSNCNTCNG